jgi:monoterpene epsilon-lactone hydrolase
LPSDSFNLFVNTLSAVQRANNPTVAEMRAGWEKIAAPFVPAPDIVFEAVTDSAVRAEWCAAPEADASRVMLFLHGGGYNIGSIASYRGFVGRLSRATQARVLSVDYRLAPEHLFPAAVDDCHSAYRWLLANGVAPNRIVVAGDSAGGGLAFSTLLAARDAGDPLASAIVAISPSTDLAKEGESIHARAHLDPLVSYETSMAHALRYVGANGDLKHPLASPLYADLHGLPPSLIMVGTHETLFDDSTRIAAKARAAGVNVELDIWEGMIHIWPFFADVLPEGAMAIDKIGQFVKAHIP